MAQPTTKPSWYFEDQGPDPVDELKPSPLTGFGQSPAVRRPLRSRAVITAFLAGAAGVLVANATLPALLLLASVAAGAVLLLIIWGNWILNSIHF